MGWDFDEGMEVEGGGKLRISWWRKEVRQPRGSGQVEIGEGKEGMEG